MSIIIEFACKQLPACLLPGNSARDNFLWTFGAWKEKGYWKEKLDAADANILQKQSTCTCSFFKVDYQVSISHVFSSSQLRFSPHVPHQLHEALNTFWDEQTFVASCVRCYQLWHQLINDAAAPKWHETNYWLGTWKLKKASPLQDNTL